MDQMPNEPSITPLGEVAGSVYSVPKKPGMLTAVAIVTLISGINNLILACGLFLTCYGAILSPYFVVTGILEIVYASKLLPDPARRLQPSTAVPVLEIIAIIGCNVVSLGAGILSLIANNDENVRRYFAELAVPRPYHPPPEYPPTTGGVVS